jgi:hypothetical protein
MPLIIQIFNFIIMRRLRVDSAEIDLSICECLLYVLCCPCFTIDYAKRKMKENDKNRKRKPASYDALANDNDLGAAGNFGSHKDLSMSGLNMGN